MKGEKLYAVRLIPFANPDGERELEWRVISLPYTYDTLKQDLVFTTKRQAVAVQQRFTNKKEH